MKEYKYNDMITRAIIALSKNIDTSYLNDRDKELLRSLCKKIELYYDMKLSSLKDTDSERILYLQSNITDILVKLNNIVLEQGDVINFTNDVNKVIRDSEIEKLVKIIKRN